MANVLLDTLYTKNSQPKTKVLLKPPKNANIYDVVIIGAGPAALASAIYTARDDLKTLVIEKAIIGGVPATVDIIENYPGFSEGITGLDFASNLQAQAEKFGVKIELDEVTNIQAGERLVKVNTAETAFWGKTLLIASGCAHKKLDIPGEEKYFNKGVHYCATCDGAFYKDKNLVVVGGGNAAVQEALFLTRYAKHIDLLVRSTIRANDILVEKLGKNSNITVRLHTTTNEIIGDEKRVTKVIGLDIKTGKKVIIKTNGVFIFAGQIPNTQFLVGSGLVFDEAGFIQVDDKMQTALKGVFAAGDVRSNSARQITCAVSDGTVAALSIREYLNHTPTLNYKNIRDLKR